MGKKKNEPKPPRHKRLNRDGRLQAAPHWIPKYEGKNLAKGYSKHFAIDLLGAVKELEMLGYSFSDSYKQQLKNIQLAEKKKERERAMKEEAFNDECDETYAYIAGYTDGGVPFGITWEEWEQDPLSPDTSEPSQDNIRNAEFTHKDDELPF
ncbi:hypothetical protein [Aquibacillus sediminis]|uniref:hypothetical protein n=1 Tax=Aquibacillus sediminis TaxID=2574734 RepID=UPI001107FC40|nr:hypothetical protein [Aquibacillus sediminis]